MAQAAPAFACWRGVHFHGGDSSRRFVGGSRGFARTWASRAGGSASFNSQVSIGVGTTAAPCPPASEPTNVQPPRPMAMPRSSAALNRRTRPSSSNRRRRPSASILSGTFFDAPRDSLRVPFSKLEILKLK
jgi:hypothetical protein